MKQKKIAAFHLLNDYSGSPLVFSQSLNTLKDAGYEIELHTSNPDSGFLANINCKKIITPYRFFSNPILRLAVYIFSQILTFMKVLLTVNKDTIIYINTLLPFGAALAGKLKGNRVIYHLHETAIRPLVLLKFLQNVATLCASQAIYVSKYLYDELPLKGVKSQVIYSSLPVEFEIKARENSTEKNQTEFTVLMVCSLKRYKGVIEFTELAKRHPQLSFEMVVNASQEELTGIFKSISSNLKIFPVQKNMHPFYQRASLVVNLTNPGLCVETFGMTLLEAMSYGIPVIAPPVGGPAEIVENGKNGYTADVRNAPYLDQLLENLASRESERIRLSANARSTSLKFSSEESRRNIQSFFQENSR